MGGSKGVEGRRRRADEAGQVPGGSAQVGLEFGKGHFDGVQIGAVGGQVVELRAAGGDGFGHAGHFVRGEVVADDEVACVESGASTSRR